VLVGLFTRFSLLAGIALMAVLTFGAIQLEAWDIAGTQLIYASIYCGLLFTLSHDRWSLDRLFRVGDSRVRN
jgi:hypothetical protein